MALYLCQDLMDYLPMHVREPKVSALIAKGQPLMVKPK